MVKYQKKAGRHIGTAPICIDVLKSTDLSSFYHIWPVQMAT